MSVANILEATRRNSLWGYDSWSDIKRHYDEEGYLILQNWLSDATVAQLTEQSAALWQEPRNGRLIIDFGEGELAGRRIPLDQAPIEGRKLNHKINDLYLENDDFRAIILEENLAHLLSILLEGRPSVVNTLHFTVGSGQRPHFDTWYMPPGIEDRMAVVAIPLEQYTDDNGPLFYYPRSHLIPKYRFSTGSLRAIDAEQDKCDEYLFGEVARRGLEKCVFLGGAGDIFIWHSQLLHGGMAVRDSSKTRRSIVVHYWRTGDINHAPEYSWMKGLERRAYAGSYLARKHQQSS